MKMQKILALGVISAYCLLGLSCASFKHKADRGPTAFDLCMRNIDYVWSNGQCVLKESLRTHKDRCLQDEVGAIFVDGTCVLADRIEGAKQRCLEKADGSTWRVDAIARMGTCFRPAQLAKEEADCKAAGNAFLWNAQDQRCYSPVAQTCKNSGNVWTLDGNCITPNQKACQEKTDGSRWVDGECRSATELACIDRGYHRKWIKDLADPNKGTCGLKSFEDFCLDKNSPPAVRHTTEALLVYVREQDCKKAADSLETTSHLELDAKGIEDILPLISLGKMKSISLQNNRLREIQPLGFLTELRSLNLAGNQIDNIFGLETLTKLDTLFLSQNRVYDLRPLASLDLLRVLYLANNQLVSIDTLFEKAADARSLESLTTIDLSSNCRLKDVSKLEAVKTLMNLTLNRTGVDKTALPESITKTVKNLEVSSCGL